MNYTDLASNETVEKTIKALEARRFKSISVQSGKDALEYVKNTVPAGASVMNGASVTLEQIGYVDYLKAASHPWNDLHAALLSENDKEKRTEMRKHAVVSDYYLGSVHALTEGGELFIASNTGSQQPHLAYTSQNLILVVGTQKIVSDLPAAFSRLEQHVLPLENEHMKQLYGMGTQHNKTLILHGESSMTGRSVTVLLVNEKLGF